MERSPQSRRWNTREQPVRSMIVAGIMSGTSADGVDVALVRISPGTVIPKIKVLGHASFPYAKNIRQAVLRAAAGEMQVAELSRLNWRLGEVYADCVANALKKMGIKIDLIGMHGQTVYHQGGAESYLGWPVRVTCQIGEAAIVAEQMQVPVVSDFRPADLAAGGQGAPLVPMLDFCLFRHATKHRVLLNLGGIANLTAIPAGADMNAVSAFDTGPANMVIDALMQDILGKNFDRGGKTASKGHARTTIVEQCLHAKWFRQNPPKSCGREQFGLEFARHFRESCVSAGATHADIIATAAELTVRSVVEAYLSFCWPHLGQQAPLARATELIVAGGGVSNGFVMGRLREEFGALDVKVKTLDEVGIASQAKEAVAFALLAWLSWHALPGNLPSATGASGGRILGKITCG